MKHQPLPTLADMSPKLAALQDKLIVEIEDWVLEHVRDRVDDVGWQPVPIPFMPFRWVRKCDPRNGALMVILTGSTEVDGKRWLHVSFSRPRRDPSYADLVLVKERFIGPEKQAITVHPRRSEHVSLHEHCLHLWACFDGDGLPDFRKLGVI